MITPRDLEWTAGFLLGEGYFGTNYAATCPRISANQVELEPMAELKRLFGGRLYVQHNTNRSRRTGLRLADHNVWVAEGHLAASLMMTLYSLMRRRSAKRSREITKALALWRGAKVAPHFRRACPQGHPYTPENTYDHPQRIASGQIRQHRICRACRLDEGYRQRAAGKIAAWRHRRKVVRALLEAI